MIALSAFPELNQPCQVRSLAILMVALSVPCRVRRRKFEESAVCGENASVVFEVRLSSTCGPRLALTASTRSCMDQLAPAAVNEFSVIIPMPWAYSKVQVASLPVLGV